MPGPDRLPLLGYGPVPGVELIPYFLALLMWVAVALGALFLSPFAAAVRLIRRAFGAPAAPATPPGEPVPPPAPPAVQPEPPVEGTRPLV